MEKVFITGATGFIGNNLVERFLEKGYKVKVLVRDKNLLDLFKWKDKVEVVLGDILEPDSFKDKINNCTIIIHSAAIISFWNKVWDRTYKVNVIGTKNILEEALKSNCKKFIHISSVAAIGYGENGEPINEEHPYNWSKLNISYMETKHQAELEVYNAIKKGLNATMLNPANVWGKGDIRGRRTRIIKAIKKGFPFYTAGGTNFVDVDAVCEAIINAIENGKTGERYILGGENLTIKEFSKIIADELKIKKMFIKIPKLPITLYSYSQEILARLLPITPKPCASQLSLIGQQIYYDSSKAIRELKMPIIPIKDCIHKTIEFYKEHNLI